MPFSSDEQRKAVFAKLKGANRGQVQNRGAKPGQPQAPTHPRAPKPPKKPKIPKVPKSSSNPQWGVGAVGYGGNYTSGVPSYANWYHSLPNTTGATPALAPSGSNMPSGYGTYDTNWSDLQWTNPKPKPYKARELTKAEKIALGIPIAAVLAATAPELATGLAGLEGAAAYVTGVGAQGGAFGYSAVALSGIEMTVIDAPISRVKDGKIYTEYADIVSWFKSKFE